MTAGTNLRERVGLVIYGPDTAAVVETIAAAEAAGVRQVWMTQGAAMPDTLIGFAAAALRTSTVRLGTAIVPTYPRHPLALAQQALAVADLAPGRLRLGIGPSHRPTIEGTYGLPMGTPLAHLREYLTVLRGLLWEGAVDQQGAYYQVRGSLPRTPRVPILVSALRANAFHLAGELSDGAISWLCPVPYLLEGALPALRVGAAAAGRPAPPIVAHLSVALSEDRPAVVAAARQTVARYARLPFYARMFADAGFPIAEPGTVPDALIESLVIFGDEGAVRDRLVAALAGGLDEILVMLVPVVDEAAERSRLMRLIGAL
ncbi:MAG: luciferase family protein [uncultured Thermomicrobiales bacterium]|uniref:Luciferase family protein n=1 Tax=uncultured Thermomicrobiales bacterium TaxID=1645740 RepID=A0A6J4VXW1_9BACT|nr:MAG: luciferase family protein [uncultured Thermomicrobiales bacterium]